jgi:hypothetical protein
MDCAEVREDRMDVLYGEAGAEALRRVEAHHAACAACAEEFLALRSVRQRLASWRLPDRDGARLARRHRRPLIALAAAAALVLALAGAVRLSGASFEYSRGGATLRVGAPDVTKLLQQQQARHQEEIRALRASLVETRPAAAPREDQLLSRVEQLIRENEQRQAARFNSSLEQLAARAEAQRRYDLARVSAGLSYLDGKNGQHVARTSELMGYVLQASEKK